MAIVAAAESYHPPIVRRALWVVLPLLVLAFSPPTAAGLQADSRPQRLVQIIAELAPPAVAGRSLAGRTRALRSIETTQRRLEARIAREIPNARVRWRYRLVLDGLAIVLPVEQVTRLAALPGVVRVFPSVRYHALLDRSPSVIGAPELWGPTLENAGQGIKIGVIDDGIDPAHPFLDAAGFAMPAGFPKGNRAFTTAKVIVARAFPPPGAAWRHAGRPLDPVHSGHGTHVAGIAAGNAGTIASEESGRPLVAGLSGVAPKAYLGNYKALTVPTESGLGLNGNSPELVAAIEAAVADGMDVINLSLGEPEIDPARDVVARALDNAAAAGVVPVVAAGNDFAEFGRGSVGSPGSSSKAITVAAVTSDRAFGVAAEVTGPGEVPPELASFGGIPSVETFPTAERALVPVAVLGADARLCGGPPLEREALAGAIALVAAGGCQLAEKARHVTDAGGIGMVVSSQRAADPLLLEEDVGLPLLLVPKATGEALASFAAASPQKTASIRISDRPAAVTAGGAGVVAPFSASGPTPLGLGFKPDVGAPGVEILSSVPRRQGLYTLYSGTSMAAPHVAGGAALLLQLHPDWTVEQVKSALVLTGEPVRARSGRAQEAASTRVGGGLVDLLDAASPRIFASPQSLSFGLLDVSAAAGPAEQSVALADAGGGAGAWAVSVVGHDAAGGVTFAAPPSVEVPGTLAVSVSAAATAPEGDHTGFLVLEKDGARRRIPYWFRVTRPALAGSLPGRVLRRPGTYRGNTAGRPSLVERYRYPDEPSFLGRSTGPEQVFRFVVDRPIANFGVAVLGGRVQPRIVTGVDENRLLGAAALPYVGNPYLPNFFDPVPTAAALLPVPGTYSIVFDSRSPRSAGPFTFRFWVNDLVPPTVELVSRAARRGRLLVRIRDGGAGVDPAAIFYSLDGDSLEPVHYDEASKTAVLDIGRVSPGRHRLVVQASDRQEAKNTENVARILPNTRVLRTMISVP